MARNGGFGLLNLSKEAIESVQGVARNIRKHLCFQENVLTNLEQCFEQLHLQGDIVVNLELGFVLSVLNSNMSLKPFKVYNEVIYRILSLGI